MRQNNRMSVMKDAARALLGTFTDVDYIGLVKFSSSASSALGETQLVQATGGAIESLEGWVDGLQDGGTTNFDDAFRMAFDLLGSSSDHSSGCSKIMLFLSDGAPNDT